MAAVQKSVKNVVASNIRRILIRDPGIEEGGLIQVSGSCHAGSRSNSEGVLSVQSRNGKNKGGQSRERYMAHIPPQSSFRTLNGYAGLGSIGGLGSCFGSGLLSALVQLLSSV
ncbi:hypothetical protein B0H63DRAFT_447559 [Podospora didyma]|uniref:Uncharacterized protein n=1 Tax=Podospora didyma TaxID=330526 RepID=A0AAE0U118_9PEZI|nr:hypothetical protein B0H63DRAFT_447559 [Podospora didyma]